MAAGVRPASASPSGVRPASAGSAGWIPPAARPQSAAAARPQSAASTRRAPPAKRPTSAASTIAGGAAAVARAARSATGQWGEKPERPKSAPAHRTVANTIADLRIAFEELDSEGRVLQEQCREQEARLKGRPTAAVEADLLKVRKQLREAEDWSIDASRRSKRCVAHIATKGSEVNLLFREIKELRAACEYLKDLNLSINTNPELEVLQKKLRAIANQFLDIVADMREQTERREVIADTFGTQLDEVEQFIGRLWDLTKVMAAHRDDCDRLMRSGRKQVQELCIRYTKLAKSIDSHMVEVKVAEAETAKLAEAAKQDEEAAEAGAKRFAETLDKIRDENKDLLKKAKQKEKESENLRMQNARLLDSLEAYRKLCGADPKKLEKLKAKQQKVEAQKDVDCEEKGVE